jgi:hypothetical protein
MSLETKIPNLNSHVGQLSSILINEICARNEGVCFRNLSQLSGTKESRQEDTVAKWYSVLTRAVEHLCR